VSAHRSTAPRPPRRTSHHGSVLAAGFWLAGVERELLKAQVLAVWEDGADVRTVPGGFVITLRRERRVAASLGRAAALVRSSGRLSSAPLRASELIALGPHDNLVLTQAGRVQGFELERLELVDPATWLEVGHFELKRPKSLGAAPEPSPALERAPDVAALFDERVGRTQADSARRSELLQALESLRAGQHSAAGTERGATRFGAALARAFGRALAGLLSRFATRRARASQPAPDALASTEPPGTGLWQRFRDTLVRWVARTPLMAQLGRKQAEYLRQLFELLAQKDDLEVMRRAIPLGKGESGPSRPALLAPTPRTSFGISLGRRAPGSSMLLVDNLFETLRRSYEAVFERLDATGKHEEAAYFLAEILGEAERAVAYLERHGRLELAAKLAEARELAPGLIVRQWFLAGQRERAVMLAVREGAFDDAILRLERAGQKGEAAALRLLQAERLAQAGCFVKAAELVYRSEHGLLLALRWLALAREAGELRGVPLELSLDPERFTEAHAALSPLFGLDYPDLLPVRLRLAEAFVNLDVSAGRPLARELARGLVAEAASSGSAAVAHSAGRIAGWVGGAFKADLPPLVSFSSSSAGQQRRFELAGNDVGARPILDVHAVDSRFLVALGEAGVVLLSRRGERITHFDLPAEALVTSLDGSRVLCVARRGQALLVGRIDLALRRSERWCELKAESFARSFDGETWLVHRGGWPDDSDGELLQLDVLDEKPRVLRRFPVPLHAPSIHFEATACNLIGAEPFGALERMQYDLPRFTLRQRRVLLPQGPDAVGGQPVPAAEQRIFVGAAAARGNDPSAIYERWLREGVAQPTQPTLTRGDTKITLWSDDIDGTPSLEVEDGRFALTLSNDTRTRILVGSFAVSMTIDLQLEGATSARVRLLPQSVVIGDSAGRLLAFEANTGAPLLDLRL
jgi:hypothetical protein